jgi:hypothetical protein
MRLAVPVVKQEARNAALTFRDVERRMVVQGQTESFGRPYPNFPVVKHAARPFPSRQQAPRYFLELVHLCWGGHAVRPSDEVMRGRSLRTTNQRPRTCSQGNRADSAFEYNVS